MQHVDADVLALAALGEPLTDADGRHLATCEVCAREADSLRAVVRVGRSVTADDATIAPAPAVWDRISAELGLGGAMSTEPRTDEQRSAEPRADEQRTDVRAVPGPAAPGDPGWVAPVVPLRRRSAAWIAAAAAAGVLVGGAGGALLAGQRGPGESPVIAEATLDALPGWEASGQAVIEQTADGGRELVLSLTGETGEDGFREVWLIDRDVTRLVSLGVLEGTEGRFTVPAGLDLADFAVVDVSEEPYDGVPAHSGDSIIRGVLDT